MNAMMFLDQFGSSARMWFDIAFLLCLFAVMVFKPERIRNLLLFRASCLLFAISIIAPSMIVFFIKDSPGLGRISPPMGMLAAIGTIFFCLSLLAAVGSLTSKSKQS